MLEIDQGSFGELYDVYISAEIPSFEGKSTILKKINK